MAFDYTAGGRWQDVIHALAIIESNEDPAATGDGGQAFGILQCHPALFQEYYGRAPSGLWNRVMLRAAPYPASVKDTWVTAQIKCCATFLEVNHGLGHELLITAWNQGVTAVKNGVRASVYVDRFVKAFTQIRGKWPA